MGFLPEQFEEDPESQIAKHNKYDFMPIDEVRDLEDEVWKKYGENDVLDESPVNELPDEDEVKLDSMKHTPREYHFGHYLDMSDPADVDFYNSKMAEYGYQKEDTDPQYIDDRGTHAKELDKLQESISERRSFSASKLQSETPYEIRKFNKYDKDKSGSRDNLKTLKNLKPEKLERKKRGQIARVKQDLVLGDTKDKVKYIDKHSLYADEFDDFLENERNPDEILDLDIKKYNSW